MLTDSRPYDRIPPYGLTDWSILSDQLSYTQHPDSVCEQLEFSENLDHRSSTTTQETISSEAPRPNYPCETAPEVFYERFEGVKADVRKSRKFNEAIDISTTYISPNLNYTKGKKIPFHPEISIPFSAQCHVEGCLRNSQKIKVLFDTGATKSHLSSTCYHHNAYLHNLPKYEPYARFMIVGNGQ